MARYRLKRYLGILFIGVVIVPAVIMSFLAIRAISHEEAYIEKQIEGTLAAEVAHVSAIVKTELADIQAELEDTIVIPSGVDMAQPFAGWEQRSRLVEIPFLLSPDYEILWPVAASGSDEDRPVSEARKTAETRARSAEPAAGEKETEFLDEQQAFLTDEEKTPVYENIAVAYKDEILDDVTVKATEIGNVLGFVAPPPAETEEITALPGRGPDRVETGDATEAEGLAAGSFETADRYAGVDSDLREAPVTSSESAGFKRRAMESSGGTDPSREPARAAWSAPEELAGEEASSEQLLKGTAESGAGLGEEAQRQSAISQFIQSESVRRKVYDKAEREGQQVLYRNVEVADAGKSNETAGEWDDKTRRASEREPATAPGGKPPADNRDRDAGPGVPEAREPAPKPGDAVPRKAARQDAPYVEAAGRIRSIFISEPLSLSEIVAGGRSGIIPRMRNGRLQLLYWHRAADSKIVGCLIDPREVRERIIGALPGIYSAVRILTVLDELGRPLIVPPGQGDRDWQKPFVAEEVSEMLPRWEVAAYLTDPDVISSRAQVATSVMWILILILFVSIAAGGMFIVRSTYAEMRLAQQRTTFVANVSHELKTPLTSIRMFAEMLRDGHQPDKQKQKKYLDIMAAETERLTRLVNNVLDFSRMERGEKRYTMKTVDLVSLCSSVVESQRTRFENNGFEVAFTTHTGTLCVHADEESIKQAVINLLSNAEKYSADMKEIEVDVRQESRSAVIGVSDRGIGIPADEVERIFNEFYRVDDKLTSRVKGAGLGLTIARRILRDHGGDIRYRGRAGGGSIFELILPLAEDKA